MSNSKVYELVKYCYRCESICSKNIFYSNKSKINGINSFCKFCMSEHMKVYIKNRIKTDINFRLHRNKRRRILHGLNVKSKSSSTRETLRIVFDTFRKWIEYQFAPEMNWFSIEINYVKPIGLFDVSNSYDLREAFNRKFTQPSLREIHFQKAFIFHFSYYQLQFIKAC